VKHCAPTHISQDFVVTVRVHGNDMPWRDSRPVYATDSTNAAVTGVQNQAWIKNLDREATIPIAPPATVLDFDRLHDIFPSIYDASVLRPRALTSFSAAAKREPMN
jgi:hypothetical protein